jgi:hypothetical protein
MRWRPLWRRRDTLGECVPGTRKSAVLFQVSRQKKFEKYGVSSITVRGA